MLSSVLCSKRAIQVNIAIMRAFVQLREMITSNKGLARRLNELEKKYDGQFRVVFEAIRELMGAARQITPHRIQDLRGARPPFSLLTAADGTMSDMTYGL